MPIINPVICENALNFPFGLEIKLVQVSRNKNSDVTLTLSPEDNVFYGLFDVEDTDFEIHFKNSFETIIELELGVRNDLKKTYYLTKGLKCSMKSMETNGRHFHFVSQQTDDGKALVAMSATKNGTTYAEEAVICSRLNFKLKIEAKKNKINSITLKALTGKTIDINVDLDSDSSIENLMELIQNTDGTPVGLQRLVFKGRQLEKERTLSDYNIRNGSIIYMVLRLRGGGGPSFLQLEGGRNVMSFEDFKSQSNCPTIPKSVGERGVVCFSQKTDQKFDNFDQQFKASKEFEIKPFSIELRMKSKYSLKIN